MLIRVVRMTFAPENVAAFLEIFKASHAKISAFPGCRSVELLQDYHVPHIYSTYSLWDSDAALNHYRSSELFGSVWKPTKALFAEPAQAFSFKPASY
ncbi:putative quinol monooxygenase [Rufibacter glacialis]|uniref:Antibiotic biosynthesis monooxygenase n=1 Tax=Rufibacter glacialis TaxID=1259555 RepID=A0A5M8QI11_9BACT|nr:antibiotic biosynthesis monooxygenase family protein [Rufibacter glacialis]KAA6434731.1 antibiotic biosynthesis monooxygenase [Rufibacter glacialis]GGK71970.1 antibiotic biosynthesis monooxygenase [Rufibacter glacialis]